MNPTLTVNTQCKQSHKTEILDNLLSLTVVVLGGTSEREFLEKIAKIKSRANEKAADVRNDFAKIHKLRAEALKKTEEMMQNSEKNLSKIEREIIKSKDLAAESRPRLSEEIGKTKEEVAEKYSDLKDEVSRAISSR
jgi:hypothetical protein